MRLTLGLALTPALPAQTPIHTSERRAGDPGGVRLLRAAERSIALGAAIVCC